MDHTPKDVFNAFLVQNAFYSENEEFPLFKCSSIIPNRLIPFSKALTTTNYDCWVNFYEHDEKINRVWNNPKRYLPLLKKFNGVIAPDFSLYRNMPLCMQKWNTYRSRALAYWWSKNSIEVLPNVRFAGAPSYAFCFEGLPKNSVYAIGTHGCLKRKIDRFYFETGLAELVKQLQPHTLLIYGTAPDTIFEKYRSSGINIIHFPSERETFFMERGR